LGQASHDRVVPNDIEGDNLLKSRTVRPNSEGGIDEEEESDVTAKLADAW
jgi:hypothetical protein